MLFFCKAFIFLLLFVRFNPVGMFYAAEIVLALETFLVIINVQHVIYLDKRQAFLDIVAIVYLNSDVLLADFLE